MPPLPKVGYPIFLEIRNPWGKEVVSDMNIFVWKLSKIAAQKKIIFYTFFGLLRFLVFFNGLFAPTSRSRMSNIFRDSEFLGKSNRKKWSNLWTFLFGSGLKSPRKKKVFFLPILPWSTLLWHRCYYPHRSRDALSPVCWIFFVYIYIFLIRIVEEQKKKLYIQQKMQTKLKLIF